MSYKLDPASKAHIPVARTFYSLQCGTLPASGFEGFEDYPRVVSHLSRHVEQQDVRQMQEPQTVADIRFDIQDTAKAEIVDDKIVHEQGWGGFRRQGREGLRGWD